MRPAYLVIGHIAVTDVNMGITQKLIATCRKLVFPNQEFNGPGFQSRLWDHLPPVLQSRAIFKLGHIRAAITVVVDSQRQRFIEVLSGFVVGDHLRIEGGVDGECKAVSTSSLGLHRPVLVSCRFDNPRRCEPLFEARDGNTRRRIRNLDGDHRVDLIAF